MSRSNNHPRFTPVGQGIEPGPVTAERNTQGNVARWCVTVVVVSLVALATSVPRAMPMPVPGGPSPAYHPAPLTPPTATPRAARRPDKPIRRPRRFAWAPAKSARYYDVALFKRGTLIFRAQTATASLTLPARWRFRDRARSLTPGDYRWFVWTVTSAGRTTTPTVRASLHIKRP